VNTTCPPGRFSGLLRRRRPLVVIAALGVATATLVPSPPPAQATKQTFASAGAEQIFTVPANVTSLHVVAVGGRGGAGADSGGAGGFGALVTSDVSVTPGQVLYIEVGGNGSDGCCKEGMGPGPGGVGGFNGGGVGGTGGPGGGGGGGASDVRTMPLAAAGSLGSRLVVAAGGGGGGGPDSGGTGVGGAAGAKGGIGGSDTTQAGAGTPTAGGAGGTNANFSNLAGQKGDLGVGGAGANVGPGGAGGGGAGGVYGGGGGAAGQQPGGGGGGGGGGGASGFASGVTNGSIVADSTGTPSVTLTYTAAVSTPVSNVFKFGKLKLGNASAALKVTVPGPGELSAEDNATAGKASAAVKKKALIKKVELTVAKAGTVTIKIKPSSAGKAVLKTKGKVSVKVKVTFAPTGGTPASKTIKVTLKARGTAPKRVRSMPRS
jgi:hypothetical protein